MTEHPTTDVAPVVRTVDPNHPDGKRELLRSIVGDIERELVALSESSAGPADKLVTLRARWQTLVEGLDLGPSMPTRVCPACGSTGMRAATRCGHCWSALAPAA